MGKKRNEMQSVIHHYKQVTGESEVDMHDVARFAVDKLGWKLPEPVDPLDRLTRDLSRAAREETRQDTTTGRPYRANHAIPVTRNGQRGFFWVDIDEAPRPRMKKAFQHRREQMVGDATMLVLDADHWNAINPGQEPLQIELDFSFDVEWRKNAPDEEDSAG